MGCDAVGEAVNAMLLEFQSTHPSGVRLMRFGHGGRMSKFQSTHPSGVRPVTVEYMLQALIFQSTHPSGVRRIVSLTDVLPT